MTATDQQFSVSVVLRVECTCGADFIPPVGVAAVMRPVEGIENPIVVDWRTSLVGVMCPGCGRKEEGTA